MRGGDDWRRSPILKNPDDSGKVTCVTSVGRKPRRSLQMLGMFHFAASVNAEENPCLVI
jgi:hypothetical protein